MSRDRTEQATQPSNASAVLDAAIDRASGSTAASDALERLRGEAPEPVATPRSAAS